MQSGSNYVSGSIYQRYTIDISIYTTTSSHIRTNETEPRGSSKSRRAVGRHNKNHDVATQESRLWRSRSAVQHDLAFRSASAQPLPRLFIIMPSPLSRLALTETQTSRRRNVTKLPIDGTCFLHRHFVKLALKWARILRCLERIQSFELDFLLKIFCDITNVQEQKFEFALLLIVITAI